MDEDRLQSAISELEVVNHRLLQLLDMVSFDENEKKYIDETRQMIKNILSELMGEEILKEIQGHMDD